MSVNAGDFITAINGNGVERQTLKETKQLLRSLRGSITCVQFRHAAIHNSRHRYRCQYPTWRTYSIDDGTTATSSLIPSIYTKFEHTLAQAS